MSIAHQLAFHLLMRLFSSYPETSILKVLAKPSFCLSSVLLNISTWIFYLHFKYDEMNFVCLFVCCFLNGKTIDKNWGSWWPWRDQASGLTSGAHNLKLEKRGAWGAQWVKYPTLVFSSDHDFRVMSWSPPSGSMLRMKFDWDSFSFFLCH